MANNDENNSTTVKKDCDHLELQDKQGLPPVNESLNAQTPKHDFLLSSLTFWKIVTICLAMTNICLISLTVYLFYRYEIVKTDSNGGTTESETTTMPPTAGTTRTILQACASSPCYNNGICTEVGYEGTKFSCACPIKYLGELCEHHINCPINQCQNGGRCNYCNGVFRCTCKHGYSGETCEVESPCSKANCRDGTICIEMGQGYDCNNDHMLHQLIKNDGSYCDPGWLQWSIYCYWISDYRANWTMAIDKCKEKSSSLLQVKTKYEIDWLHGQVNESVWVGGRRDEDGDNLKWENPSMVLSNQSPLWEKCEPNGNGRLCMEIWHRSHSFLLDDTYCEEEHIFVCKYKPGSLN